MRQIVSLVVLLFLLVNFATAGQVYGTVTERYNPVGHGVEVKIKCGGDFYQGKTDRYGSYEIYIPDEGGCNLTVHYRGQPSDSVRIYSYDDPVRYDFDLRRKDDGRYELKRR